MKITEPKTPYIHYDHENDVILGNSGSIPPFELSAALESVPPTSRSSSSGSLFGDKPQTTTHHAVIQDEWDSDDEESDPEEREKHKRFAALRAEHYHMREALQKGRQLAEHTVAAAESGAVDDEKEDEDDGGVNGGSDETEEDFYEESSSADEQKGTGKGFVNNHNPTPPSGMTKMDLY
ncbi:hypothetical protein HK097_010235 [Rhizophlyctis rosea]|uniref:Protein phosphatase inhibitor 2 n=1 Tax=Rhizophlyctis rosea TaxID=64517 RepID=A0AAD5X2P5_9FUNG|nr:hypothetical protein HK097_010235 [Rhizophlyctis rosea]